MVFLFLLFLFVVVFVRSSFSSLLPLHLSNCLVAHVFIFFSFLAARKEEEKEEEEEEQ
jgi:Ca2+/Na+ antiporter